MTACFAVMVGAQGRAVGVEHIPELVAQSIKNIESSAAAPLLKEGSLSMHVGGMCNFPFICSLMQHALLYILQIVFHFVHRNSQNPIDIIFSLDIIRDCKSHTSFVTLN